MTDKGDNQNPRLLIQSLVSLSKREWTLLDTAERQSVASNCLRALKLLTAERQNLERIFLEYPELLPDTQ